MMRIIILTTWERVPLQDFSISSDIEWSRSLSKIDVEASNKYGCEINEIDAQLYKKYKLFPEEINYIESMIKPME